MFSTIKNLKNNKRNNNLFKPIQKIFPMNLSLTFLKNENLSEDKSTNTIPVIMMN